jgi:uncharacterized membrane protein
MPAASQRRSSSPRQAVRHRFSVRHPPPIPATSLQSLWQHRHRSIRAVCIVESLHDPGGMVPRLGRQAYRAGEAISRRRERGEDVSLGATLTAWKGNVPAIGLYAVILALLMAVWIRVSVVVVALFFEGGVPTLGTLARDILQSDNGLFFVLAYAAAGFGFALLVFATSVVSLPMLLDREQMDTLTAMIVSFNALRANFLPMLLWGAILVALVAAGFASLYLGLVFVLPLIGHASWHAYRDTVAPET